MKFILVFCLLFLEICAAQAQVRREKSPNASCAKAGKFAKTVQMPLRTLKSDIVDSKCEKVLLRGVNWFGFEKKIKVFEGLHRQDYDDILNSIRDMGFNFVRVPFSFLTVNSKDSSKINYNLGKNKDLQGKAPFEIMKLIVKSAEEKGIMILFDFHTFIDADKSPSESQITGLWYDDKHTEQQWIESWLKLAKIFSKNRNVIGAELKNEPHWPSTWGLGNPKTDWNKAAERAGNAILKVAPDWLIVVQGVGSRENNNQPQPADGQQLAGHLWGGNLEGVRKHPVRLNRKNRLVYSVHEYGASFHVPDWIKDRSFPSNLSDRWEKGFFYIVNENIAPVIITEFGGLYETGNSKDAVWQNKFGEFIQKNNLSFAYWCLNFTNGADGIDGIFLEDWKSTDPSKTAFFSKYKLTGAPFMQKTSGKKSR